MKDGSPRWPQVLLGVFIVWQLFFIFALNYTQLMLGPADGPLLDKPDGAPPDAVDRAADLVRNVTQRWANLTGQYQSWWLFAVTPHDSTFPHVELRWQEPGRAPVHLDALQEPVDTASYFRLPGGSDRLFHYEMNVEITYRPYDEQFMKTPQRYLQRAQERWPAVLAYLKWRLGQWQAEHPEAPPPSEVVLFSRSYTTPPPGAAWERTAPVNRDVFRWRPGAVPAAGFAPLEVYDPRRKGFVPLALGDSHE